MKLIIDIPDIYYSACREWKINGVATMEQGIIANGIPYEEQPIGEWVYLFTFCDSKVYECNHCKGRLSLDIPQRIEDFKYCNGCGAKMKMKGGETNGGT